MSNQMLKFLFTICVLLKISWSFVSTEENDPDDYDPEFAGGYPEGDLIPDSPSRNGYPNKKWPLNTVFYYFNGNFTDAQKEAVRAATKRLESVSCVRFLEVNYLFYGKVCITNDPTGCNAQVGYQGTFCQNMNLGPKCFDNEFVMCHEWLHVLGFTHTHNAYNRDDIYYIHNFVKRNDSVDCLQPNKKDSVLTYKSTAFSKNGEDTLVPRDGDYTDMGQRYKLSTEDIAKLNSIYCYNNCTATTNTTTSTSTTTTTTTTAAPPVKY
ncbi:seminal metalloprotease 1-like [Musca autumnalis]|uniref:seminal metalloprotease 1-like n=1 Tax=Musca autumnalis TaxID=221902 RepID=UPI003CEAEFF8